MASFLGHPAVVPQLLDAGSDPMLRTELGFNSIDLVALPWNDEQKEHLIELSERLQTDFEISNRLRS
jgi:hypothetical protein